MLLPSLSLQYIAAASLSLRYSSTFRILQSNSRKEDAQSACLFVIPDQAALVQVYSRVHVCLHAPAGVYVQVYMHACIRIYKYTYIYIHICMYMYTDTQLHRHTQMSLVFPLQASSMYTYTNTYTYMYVYRCIHTHKTTHTHTHTHRCLKTRRTVLSSLCKLRPATSITTREDKRINKQTQVKKVPKKLACM